MSTCELTRPAGTGGDEAIRIGDVRAQDRVTLTGIICATQTIAVGTGVAYSCVLADGTGDVDVLFLGRATVAGLAVGMRCSIRGVLVARGGRLAVWNPRYEVLPAADGPD